MMRRTVLALIAALAMLFQGLLAADAMAAPASQTIEICTAHGLKTIAAPDAPGKQGAPACPHCDQCVVAALAVTAAPSPLAVPTAYSPHPAFVLPSAAYAPYAARAPPRPPGQAPPLS